MRPDDKSTINARVQRRYDELMAIGKHGQYETLFQIVHEERANAIKPLVDWYDADNEDAILITRTEMGIVVGRHPIPKRQICPEITAALARANAKMERWRTKKWWEFWI